MKKNVGNLDAILRFIFGCFLIYLGLFLLDGLQGNWLGIIVALISIMPFYTGATKKCYLFKVLNVSTIPKKNNKD